MPLRVEPKPEEARRQDVRDDSDVCQGVGAAEERCLPEVALKLVVETREVTLGSVVHSGMHLAAAHLHYGDRVCRGVQLRVGQVLDEATLGPETGIRRVKRRLGVAVLEILADDRRVVEREPVLDERRNLGARIHMDEIRPVAVPVECPHALKGKPLLVQCDPDLARVGAEDVVEKGEHESRLPSGRSQSHRAPETSTGRFYTLFLPWNLVAGEKSQLRLIHAIDRSMPVKRVDVLSAMQHPLAGTEMSGADMIMQVLADEGVDTIFGYSGGAILPTYDAIFRYNESHADEEEIRLIVPATEQGAGFMAAGYARSSGRGGVFVVTSGPGATNAVTPIRDCQADSIPVVLITGQVPRAAMGTDAFQEAPVFNIMAPCAKHVFLLTDETKIEATLRTAFEIARSGRPGPVVVDIPRDVQLTRGIFKGSGLLPLHGYTQRLDALKAAKMSASDADAFFKLLGNAQRPLLYVGGGVINSNAANELRAFAQRFGIPVVTTLMGIGAVDTMGDLSLHMLGMHGTAYANYAVEDCDLLIAVGSRFDDRVAGKVKEFAPGAKIAHIDIDASEIGKVKNVDWAYCGDAKGALAQLLRASAGAKKDFSRWRAHLADLKAKHALSYNRDSAVVQAEYVLEQLNQITRGEAIVSTGVGQHQMWAAQYLDFKRPRSWLTSGSMGTMGFGLPAAVGAQLANPGALVIDVDGDGSIRMNYGELETLTTYDIPVKVLLLNNLGDGMVRQWQDLFYANRYSGSDKTLHKKDFVKAVQADGFGFARRVTQPVEVRAALEEFIKFQGPAFLEVMVDTSAHVYPMVGPGMGYKDMITGKWIPSRDQTKAKDETEGGYF